MKLYVFHYTEQGRIPQLTPEVGKALKKALPEILANNPGVKYNGTMFDPSTGIGICDWEASDAKTVENIMNAMQIPFDTVVPVQSLVL